MTQKEDALIDVLCIGHAAYDLTFAVDRHLGPDEKTTATEMAACGVGPAANAAVAAARFGSRAAFVGYLGGDDYGRKHLDELVGAGVETRWIVRGQAPTPVSAAIVKPDGSRALVNYRAKTPSLSADAVDLNGCRPGVVLFDGHEPELSLALIDGLREKGVFTLLDAGSLHPGTEALADKVDYLAASETFARQYTGESDPTCAIDRLAAAAPVAVITLGGRGLVWKSGEHTGEVPAFFVSAVDTTGAGDVFHGVLAACIAAGKEWDWCLRCASAAAALCCQGLGARAAIPTRKQVVGLLGASG
ncbi:MAG: hypothetical protein K9K88_04305 [Desulfobacterales bacterium]|nr:hypothetical protein [Desulfobacterales bacterium]